MNIFLIGVWLLDARVWIRHLEREEFWDFFFSFVRWVLNGFLLKIS